MAEIATYTWSSFNEEDAKIGLRVGFKQTEDSDLSMTGILKSSKRFTTYQTVIDGKTLYINNLGVVMKSVPEDASLANKTVQIVTCEMKTSYGNQQGITRGVSEDSETVATLSSMEPRDQFALYAMQAIMRSLDEPAEMDDANILFNCRAAYRWAQGMMIASADARAEKKKSTDEGGEGGSGDDSGQQSGTTRSTVDTSGGTDTEKLLGNLVSAVDDLTKQTKANSEAMLKATLKIDNATTTTGEGESATTTPKKLQVEGAGGDGTKITRDDVNDGGDAVTDVLGYNSAIGKAPVRFTISNLLKKLVSLDTPLSWLRKKGETDIASASTFFTQYKDEMATALADKFDTKGAAAQALTDAKSYTDTEISKKHPS